jgi:glucosyl-3-phosphoglycerate synthase
MSYWLKTHTFHHSEFEDIARLVALKQAKGHRISLAFPTLNEEATIGDEILAIRSELMERRPLLDEIAVIDSGSVDRTLEVAAAAGADVYSAQECLPQFGHWPGKGDNLWKSLYLLSGDILVWLDGDIKNIHPKFVYGLVGPLLHHDHLQFVKAFYERPLQIPGDDWEYGGGRVTEILVRPLLFCFFPELARVYQPCAGEVAARRGILEELPFAAGYGIETGMLIDIFTRFGPGVMAQVNLDRRVHRHQPVNELGKMGFEILHAFFSRLEESERVRLAGPLADHYRKLVCGPSLYTLEETTVQVQERPPMRTVRDYQVGRGGIG